MMARHVRRSQASSAILRRREPNLVDFVELLIVIAIYDLLMSRILTGREIFIALAGQSGGALRSAPHPPRYPCGNSALVIVLIMEACPTSDHGRRHPTRLPSWSGQLPSTR